MSIRRLFYTLVLYLIFPFVILRLLWRSRNNRAYRQRIGERLGFVSLSGTGTKKEKPVIWLHAVSVGETIAAKPLIEALIDQYPDYRLLVTSTTPTGSAMVKKLFAGSVAKNVEHVYFPYDLPEIIFRFLGRVKPHLLIIVETEIWPNLYASCEKRKIPMMLVNARLSQRSTKGYQKTKGLVEETLQRLDVIAVRSDADAEHFRQLGALDEQLVVAGNIKFDLQLDKDQISNGGIRREQWGIQRPVWVAASTHTGEDEQILQIYSHLLQQYPDLLLVLIPRHFERFDEVYSLCQSQAGLSISRHSLHTDYIDSHVNIILGDTMGEMQSWYAAADVVFMGGSLVATGGHNPLEAIAIGVPVVSGSYVFNFEDIYPLLTKAGLSWVCGDVDQIQEQLLVLLDKNNSHSGFRSIANKLMQKQGGVTSRLISKLSEIFKA